MRVSYMMHHIALQRTDTSAANRLWLHRQPASSHPCWAYLHGSASYNSVIALPRKATRQAGRCSLQATAVKTHACNQRDSRTADDNDDKLPSILPSALRDPGCTTPGRLEALLAGWQAVSKRRIRYTQGKARVSLDPVPWESSGSLNAGRHRRGSGKRYRSYHPLGPLSNNHRAAEPLAASPARPCPMTAAFKRPFQASVHEESTRRMPVRDMGKRTWE